MPTHRSSIPVYKNRLKEWGIRKYTTRAENTALLAHATAKKIRPKDAVIMKNGREWDSGAYQDLKEIRGELVYSRLICMQRRQELLPFLMNTPC